MLIRYWTWTSTPSSPATSSLPFGPLRFRAWSNPSGTPVTPAVTGLAFGPLRYRAWTSGTEVRTSGGGGGWRWIPYSPRKRARDEEDETAAPEVRAQAAERATAALVAEADARIRYLERLARSVPALSQVEIPDDYGWQQVLAERQRQQQALLAQIAEMDRLIAGAIQEDELLLMLAALAV